MDGSLRDGAIGAATMARGVVVLHMLIYVAHHH
jgi:hypothetical protein